MLMVRGLGGDCILGCGGVGFCGLGRVVHLFLFWLQCWYGRGYEVDVVVD